MRPEFTAILEELAHGEVNRQASDQLAELVQAVRDTGKAGKLALTLSVTQEGSRCVIDASIKTTKPTPGVAPSIFFYGKEPGEITREDPRQLDLKTFYVPNSSDKVIDFTSTKKKDDGDE